jgi:hypothetical protein
MISSARVMIVSSIAHLRVTVHRTVKLTTNQIACIQLHLSSTDAIKSLASMTVIALHNRAKLANVQAAIMMMTITTITTTTTIP